MIGLDLSDVSVDGSLHKAPAGGEGTGPNPTDLGKCGWKWSIVTDSNGIPFGWAIDDAVIAKKRKRNSTAAKKNQPMGLRWPVERTNSWLWNFGQLRRNTDRRTIHRLAQFALAVALLLTAKLIDWRNRWSPTTSPIR